MSSSADADQKPISILFVCLGNICRSPMAEAYFHALLLAHPSLRAKISRIDSAGTAAYHAGSSPDPRTMATLRSHGVRAYKHTARPVSRSDFKDFDYILAMDRANLRDLRRMQGNPGAGAKAPANDGRKRLGEVRLFGEGAGAGGEADDPYYGGDEGFEECYNQVQRFARVFLWDVCEWSEDENDRKGKAEATENTLDQASNA